MFFSSFGFLGRKKMMSLDERKRGRRMPDNNKRPVELVLLLQQDMNDIFPFRFSWKQIGKNEWCWCRYGTWFVGMLKLYYSELCDNKTSMFKKILQNSDSLEQSELFNISSTLLWNKYKGIFVNADILRFRTAWNLAFSQWWCYAMIERSCKSPNLHR